MRSPNALHAPVGALHVATLLRRFGKNPHSGFWFYYFFRDVEDAVPYKHAETTVCRTKSLIEAGRLYKQSRMNFQARGAVDYYCPPTENL